MNLELLKEIDTSIVFNSNKVSVMFSSEKYKPVTKFYFGNKQQKTTDSKTLMKIVVARSLGDSLINHLSLKVIDTLPPEYKETLLNVAWKSQFNKSTFGKCKGCWRWGCCNRATVYMLGFTNTANCTVSSIAKSNPIIKSGKIDLAKFSDVKNVKTLCDSKTLISEDFEAGTNYLKSQILEKSKPVAIGVHYTNRGNLKHVNNNPATYHYMVIVGFGNDEDGEYFRFYDPGRNINYKSEATSKNNKLYINNTKKMIQGAYQKKTYTITQIYKYD